jgi:hypothetical protein
LARFGAAFAPPARDNYVLAGGLGFLPLFDSRTIESPVAADAKAWEQTLPQEAINRRRMNAQMFRQFFNREDIVLGCHNDANLTALYLLNAS